MDALVTYELEGSVATIAMDDGKLNVLSTRMFEELKQALDRAEAESAVVVLTGREGVFSAGFDLTTLKAGGREAEAMLRGGFALAERLLSFPTPVVVACSGHAVAMGFFLVLAADYRLGAAGKFKLTANEVAIGLTMPLAAIEICRQRLAPAHFNRAVLLSEVYTPELAPEAGILDRVVPQAELRERAREVAAGLAKLDSGAHAATKLRARSAILTAIRAGVEADFGTPR
jgi:enoyl-CoA hydratase